MESIELTHDSALAGEELKELEVALRRVAPKVTSTPEEPGPQSAVEWALPALIVISIAKPILDGFLGEFGVDLAKGVKVALMRIHRRLRGRHRKWLDAVELQEAQKRLANRGAEEGHLLGKVGLFLTISVTLEQSELRLRKISFKVPSELSPDEFKMALEQLAVLIPAAVRKEEAAEARRKPYLGVSDVGYGYKNGEWIELG